MNRITKIDRYKNNKTSVHWSLSYYFSRIFSRINFSLMIFLSCYILVNYKNNTNFHKQTKNIITKIAYPQIFLIKTTDSLITNSLELLSYFYKIKKENFLLKKEIFSLKQQTASFKNISEENQKLKTILNFTNTNNIENYKIIELDIVNKNIFSNRIAVNYGLIDGISENDLVVDLEKNVIGKIINVENNKSEILLLTDPKSRIVVKTELSKLNFMAFGNENKYLTIDYILGEEYNFKDKELVFANNLKIGLKNDFLVGVLVKDRNNKYKVKTKINFNKIDFGIIILSK